MTQNEQLDPLAITILVVVFFCVVGHLLGWVA